MAFKETLVAAREQRGMTQQDLAEKLYVTRQAVSRWENGETEPSVDMRKLIATVLDVPVIQLFDIDVSQLCQCCGTPFTVPNMPHGTETDGTENTAYCKWCYDGGQFAYQSEDELIEKTAPLPHGGHRHVARRGRLLHGRPRPSPAALAEVARG